LESTCLLRSAIFVDYECIKGDPPVNPGHVTRAIRRDISSRGVVQLSKHYFAMGLANELSPIDQGKIFHAYEAGSDPVPIPSFRGSDAPRKSLVDPSAIVDIIDTLHTHPEISAYCVATCDKDFLPALRKLAERGKYVRLYYRGDAAKILLQHVDSMRGDGFSGSFNLDDLLQNQ